MSTSVLFKFLDNATKMPTLLQIRREIEGEIQDDSDSDSEGEEEDVGLEVEGPGHVDHGQAVETEADEAQA